MAITFDNGSGTWTAEYSAHYAMIEKIAKQAVYNVQSINPLSWIDKGRISNGVSIEDAVIQLATSTEWKSENQTGANLNAPAYPSLKVTYHSEWNGKQFKTTYSEDQIRKVLLSGGNEAQMATKIVANLTESEGDEDYQASKQILVNARDVNIVDATPGITYSADATLIKTIKNVTDEMQFMNNKYVAANYRCRTPFERIHLIMSFDVFNALNIDVLASLYNLEKAELLTKITLIDDPGYVYLVDMFGLVKYTRLYKMTSKYIEDGLYSNYWLTVDRMYGSNNLFKMAYLKMA